MAPKVAKTSAQIVKGDGRKPKGFNPYVEFCKTERENVKANNPTASLGEMSKILGTMWKNLGDNEKVNYGYKPK